MCSTFHENYDLLNIVHLKHTLSNFILHYYGYQEIYSDISLGTIFLAYIRQYKIQCKISVPVFLSMDLRVWIKEETKQCLDIHLKYCYNEEYLV